MFNTPNASYFNSPYHYAFEIQWEASSEDAGDCEVETSNISPKIINLPSGVSSPVISVTSTPNQYLINIGYNGERYDLLAFALPGKDSGSFFVPAHVLSEA